MKLRLSGASEKDLGRIHESSLKILTETGCVFHSPKAIEILKKHGAKVTGKTAFFPKELVEKSIKTIPPSFYWRARNDAFSTTIGEGGFRLAPNAGNIYVQDLDNGRRLAKLEDVSKIQTIHQLSDATDFVGNNPCDPSDIDILKKHLYVTYETLKHTNKPLVSYFAPHAGQTLETLQMVRIAFGQETILMQNHVIGTSLISTSPLSYSEDTLNVMTAFAEHNQPVMITAAAMGGITAPLNLMGIAIQQNAELLAGTIYVQMVNPGNPVVWGPSSTVAWLKTASYGTGSPEAMLPNIVGFQLANDLYNIPTRNMAGSTDAKAVDCQAGYETMQNLMLAMLGGAQIVYEALGVLDNIMTTSYEKIIIDEELYQRVVRICRGLDTAEQELPLNLIQEIGCGGEHLTHQSTLDNLRSMWKPTVSNWDNYYEWQKGGHEDAVRKANKVWKERLQQAPQSYLDPEVDKELKAFIAARIN
jgi:trimethylamine--corrinoid protein Co-methyltransferase